MKYKMNTQTNAFKEHRSPLNPQVADEMYAIFRFGGKLNCARVTLD